MKSFFSIFGIVFYSMLYSQTTYTFHTAGNWTDAANWSPSYPGYQVNNVIININANCNVMSLLGSNITINISNGVAFTSSYYLQCFEAILNNYGIYNNTGFNEMADWDINNYGTINVSAPLSVGWDIGNTSQVFNNYGSISINNGSALVFVNDLTFNNIGSLNIGSGGWVYLGYTTSNTGTILGSGNFEVCATCTYISSPTSTIQPGNSPGGISFNNINGAISPASTYNFEINGATQISQYDWIGIENINLTNSTLNVTWGFTPSAGQVFDIITHGSRTGQFATMSIPPISGLNFTVDYSDPSKTSIVVSSALPVTWRSSPTANIKNNQSNISWSVALQVNNSHFIIEHSSNGRSYSEIGKVEGHGNTSETKQYTYIHELPSIGINYYRIKQVDYDGKSDYSDVVSVNYVPDGREISIYPNPATSEVTISTTELTSVQIMDVYGRLLLNRDVSDRQNTINLSELPTGILIFVVGDQRFKILKE